MVMVPKRPSALSWFSTNNNYKLACGVGAWVGMGGSVRGGGGWRRGGVHLMRRRETTGGLPHGRL